MSSITGRGPAVCVGDDIDTDLIIAGRYLRTKDRSVFQEHVFEDLDPTLAARLQGAVLVAGKNLGCGSSREQAVVALQQAGIKAVIARSAARIFFRNCINRGLPVFIVPDLFCHEGDEIRFDTEKNELSVAGKAVMSLPLSARMNEILASGGLVSYIRRETER